MTGEKEDLLEICYLGLGSNLGNREANLRQALGLLTEVLSEMKVSSCWESFPRDYVDQPLFLNMVARGTTNVSPANLLLKIHAIESALGRLRDLKIPKGPRFIDIDILLYGKKIISQSNLIVPHPAIRERKFVLLPLLELDESLTDPVTGGRFLEYLGKLPPQGIYAYGPPMYDVVHP